MLQQEQLGQAESTFQEALRFSQADERAQWGMSEVYWKQGKHDEAVQHLSQAVKLSGQNPDLVVRLGEMQLEQGNLEEAVHQAEAALDISRQHERAWALKGMALEQMDRARDAMKCYQMALLQNPENTEVRIAVAGLHRRLGKPQNALAAIDRLSDKHLAEELPARAWLFKGLALSDLGQLDESRACLLAAARSKHKDPRLWVDLARAQLDRGELAEARLCLGNALQRNPQNPQALELQQSIAAFQDRFHAATPSNTAAYVTPAQP